MGGKYRDAPIRREGGGLADHPGLADAGRPHEADDTARSANGLVQDGGDRVELPRAPDQFRLAAATGMMVGPFFTGDQAPRGYGPVGALDLCMLALAQHGD